MNGLTTALRTAQRSVSPRWRLSLRAAARSTAWQGGGEAWQEVAAFPAGLATWNAQAISADAATGETGILRVFASWVDGKIACQYVPAAALGSSSTWTTPAVVSVATHTPTADLYTPKPALFFEGGRWHLFYRLPTGGIQHRSSSNNGASWSAATALYTGSDVAGDLFACHVAASNLHLLQFSTQTDAIRPRGASRLGHTGAWNLWATHGSTAGWLPAGLLPITGTGGLGVEQIVYSRATSPHTLTVGRFTATLTAAGALSSRDATVTPLWMVSGDGALRPRKFAAGPGLGGALLALQDAGATRAYACAGALIPNAPGSSADDAPGLLEEPLLLRASPLPAAPLEGHLVPLESGLETWIVGAGLVFRCVRRFEDVTVGDDDILRYRLEVDAQQGGRLQLELRAGSAAAHPTSGVAVGHALWLTRTCEQGDPPAGGSVTLGLRVVRVERVAGSEAAYTRVTALDALGLLAATAARRPLQFDPATFTLAQAAEALVGWAGLRVERAAGLAGALSPFQWHGGEAGLRALRRLLRAEAVILRSRTSAPGEPPTVWIGPAEAAAGEAFGLYAAAGAGSVHPLVQRVRTEDATAARLAVVHGWAVRNTPAGGEDWALALAERTTTRLAPGVRPLPLYLLNRNLGSAEQATTAAGLRAGLEAGLRSGWFEAQAHLALEPHDWVTLEGEDARVVAIEERWEQGRLVQRVDVAP